MRWKGNPLQNLTTRKGNWRYSEYFALVDTAHEWGERPSALGLCEPGEDLAVMQGYTDAVTRMRAWENQEQEREMKRRSRRRR